VTVSVWRIAVEAPTYTANDLTGTGAKISGGRWNSIGTPIVYCAMNVSLATLETIIYIRTAPIPYNRYLVRIDIPDDIWNSREILDPLPGGWDAVPSGLTSRKVGDQWIAANTSAILVVPSVIVPDDNNVLINPHHPDTTRVIATIVKKWYYDPRFF